MTKSLFAFASALVLAALSAGSASADGNLVMNGDFSGGNTGFSSSYELTTMTPYLFQNGVHGIYALEAIGSVAGSSAYGDWDNVTTDPLGGNGYVYVADGATDDPPKTVWTEFVAVTPNTNYTFTYYAAEISNACCSNAVFQVAIDGTTGAGLTATGAWQSASFVWNSGANDVAGMTLTDLNEAGGFNDFVLTDISLIATGVPEPVSWALMLTGFGVMGGTIRIARRKSATAVAA